MMLSSPQELEPSDNPIWLIAVFTDIDVAVGPAPGFAVAAGDGVGDTVVIGVARLLADLGDQPRRAAEDVLRHDRAVADRPELVGVNRLSLEAALDPPLARVVVLVALRAAVIGDLLDAFGL